MLLGPLGSEKLVGNLSIFLLSIVPFLSWINKDAGWLRQINRCASLHSPSVLMVTVPRSAAPDHYVEGQRGKQHFLRKNTNPIKKTGRLATPNYFQFCGQLVLTSHLPRGSYSIFPLTWHRILPWVCSTWSCYEVIFISRSLVTSVKNLSYHTKSTIAAVNGLAAVCFVADEAITDPLRLS